MDKKQRFFIYDRKEVGVLLLLGVLVAVFAFTLGVHLGKKVSGKGAVIGGTHFESATTVADGADIAHDQVLNQPSGVPVSGAEDMMSQALHDEVVKTGVRLEDTHQVVLPGKAKSVNAGATTLKNEKPVTAQTTAGSQNRYSNDSKEAPLPQRGKSVVTQTVTRVASGSEYLLQIGSFPSSAEAKARLQDLEASGLKPKIQEADLKKKGHWFRIYVGAFPSKEKAEMAGEQYKSQGLIQSYVIAKASTKAPAREDVEPTAKSQAPESSLNPSAIQTLPTVE